MKIRQIGNGSAFNYTMTNSSFVVENDNEFLLIDCGYNVFGKLRELEKKDSLFPLSSLTRVFITHMDDDHVGSLKTLIYHQFFANGIIMDIYAKNEVYVALKNYLGDVSHVMDSKAQYIENCFYKLYNDAPQLEPRLTCTSNILINTIKASHGKPCYGIRIRDTNNNKTILVSGDSKATMGFYRELKHSIMRGENILAYHDYSKRNVEPAQVHACEEDFNLLYNDYQDVIIKYHNDDINYNKEWR